MIHGRVVEYPSKAEGKTLEPYRWSRPTQYKPPRNTLNVALGQLRTEPLVISEILEARPLGKDVSTSLKIGKCGGTFQHKGPFKDSSIINTLLGGFSNIIKYSLSSIKLIRWLPDFSL
jgi:hypothetical protein